MIQNARQTSSSAYCLLAVEKSPYFEYNILQLMNFLWNLPSKYYLQREVHGCQKQDIVLPKMLFLIKEKSNKIKYISA